ncbi:MAG: chorismate synthase [Actinobacteria bacterium]|nr:chorismate synthase [Actinomycetota bacterium]MBU1942251.1 chorismate synthase [Actinomycetota bacterium]MBU2687400.1 chorismate synthase [Actinomycetota bacterium]
MALRLTTAGESHGPALVAVLEGVPAGLELTAEYIDRQLARRRRGYGRGGRMDIEDDAVRMLAGVRLGRTLGTPVALLVENRDHANWVESMSPGKRQGPPPRAETRPRPGHGDLAGMLKWGTHDARDVLERASARETAARCAAGAVAARLLEEVGITVASAVVGVGRVTAPFFESGGYEDFAGDEDDPLRCRDAEASARMRASIDAAREAGDSLGGLFEVAVFGVPPGLGTCARAEGRLDARLFGALGSIPAIKGVEAGAGFALAGSAGSEAHDEITRDREKGLGRGSNRAGGLEAGMTNGEVLLLRAAMKPIPSLASPLATVDLETLEPAVAFKERADVCAVPAAAVVAEAVVALVLADALMEKFGGDTVDDLKAGLASYLDRIGDLWRPRAR